MLLQLKQILPLFFALGCLTTTAHADMIVDRGFQILRGQQSAQPAINDAVTLKNNQQRNLTQSPPSAAVSANSDSYTSEVVAPAMYVKSAPYSVDFPLTQAIPEGMVITNVSWSYSLSQHPLGLEALLCWNKNSVCRDISLFESGRTDMFNGQDPGNPFTLYLRWGGKGAISPPINGGKTYIIVTYTRQQ